MRKKKIYLSKITARNGQLVTGFLKGNLLTVEALLFKKFGPANKLLVGAMFDIQAQCQITPGAVMTFNQTDPKALLDLINLTAMTHFEEGELEITSASLGGSGVAFIKSADTSRFRGSRSVSFNAANGLPEYEHYSFTTPEPEEWSYEDDDKAYRTMKSTVKQRARNREAAYLHWKSSVNLLAAAQAL